MRLLLIAILSFSVLGCATKRERTITSVEIKEIKPRYMETEQFKRFSEYMNGAEHQGGRMILRTNPEERDGYYFTLIIDKKVRDLPKGTVVIGEFFTPQSVEAQIHEFTLPNKRPKTKEIFLGLTGEDWPQVGGVPGAWRFTIKNASGVTLGTKQSYLWSM